MNDHPDRAAGRAAWRVWVPPLVTTLITIAEVCYGKDALVPPTDHQLIIVLTGTAALLWRLRHPLAVTAVTVLTGATLPLVEPHVVVVDTAGIVALYTLATLRERRVAVVAALVAAAVLTATSAPWQSGGLLNLENLIPVNYAVLAVAVGDAVRNQRRLVAEIRARAAEAERTREQEARRQVREERIRIARDLHDVVAHHITVVNAQAGVAHHLLQRHPDEARQALAGIRETSRAALDELRATVGLLRSDDEPAQSRAPAPSFADLDDLISSFRGSGFSVVVHRSGVSRPLTASADLAAYRILQEALTNAGKHGTTGHAEVHITYGDTRLRLTVTNPAEQGRRGAGTRHGLIGMRERADAAAGSLTAGMRDDGTFAVQVDLPLDLPHHG